MELKKIKTMSHKTGGIIFEDNPEVWVNPENDGLVKDISGLNKGDSVNVSVNGEGKYTFIKKASENEEMVSQTTIQKILEEIQDINAKITKFLGEK